ncbi:MAG: PKD-like domain-containing protein [Flavobacteriaceae bacterium]
MGTAQSVVLSILPKPVLTNNVTLTLCSNDSINFIPEFNVSDSELNFNWTRGAVPGISNPPVSGSQNIIDGPLINTTTQSQTVIYNYTITTSSGCDGQGSFVVVVDPRPQLTADSQNTINICSGEDVNKVLESNMNDIQFTWTRVLPENVISNNNPGTYTTPNPTNSINEILINNNTGAVTVTYNVTLSGSNGGCSDQVNTIEIVVYPAPQITVPEIINICSGDSINTLLSSNIEQEAQFLWSRTDTNTSINGGNVVESGANLIDDVLINTDTQTQQAIYTVYVGHQSCQSRQNSVTLTVNVGAPITFNYSQPEVKCSGASPTNLLDYFSSNVTSFNWSRNAITGLDNSLISGTESEWDGQTLINSSLNDIEITYQVEATDGLCTETFSYLVIVRANPRIENNNLINLCVGEPFDYGLDLDPGVNVVSWKRTDSDVVSGTSQNIYDNQLVNTTAEVVEYFYDITIENPDGCNSTEVLRVNINPDAIVNNISNDNEICSGSLFNFTPTSNVANAQISWQRMTNSAIEEPASNGQGSISERITLASGVSSSVIVTYRLTAEAGGCSSSTTLQLNVLPPPLLGTIGFEGSEYTSNELIEICSNTPFEIEVSPFEPTGGVTQVNNVPIYRVKSWSRAQQSGINESGNSFQGLETMRSLTISESLENITNNLLYVTYEITLENTATECEKVYDYVVGIKPQYGVTLASSAETTFQTLCEGEDIDLIAYNVIGEMENYTLNWEKRDVNSNWVSTTLSGITHIVDNGQIKIQGTIATYGSYRYLLQATDSCGNVINKTGTIDINEIPVFTLNSGSNNQSVCMGSPIVSIEILVDVESSLSNLDTSQVISDNIPNGLTVSKTQVSPSQISVVIQGTPLIAGSYDYNIIVNGDCTVSYSGLLVIDNTSEIQRISDAVTENQIVCNGNDIDEIRYSIAHFDNWEIVWTSTDRVGNTNVTQTPPGIDVQLIGGAEIAITGQPNISALSDQSLIYNYQIQAFKEGCVTYVYPPQGALPSIQTVLPIQINEELIDSRLRACRASDRYIDLSQALSGGSIPISSTVSVIYSYDWASPNGVEFSSLPKIENLVEGNYSVVITDLLSNCSSDIEFEVLAQDQLSLSPSNGTSYYTQVSQNMVNVSAVCDDDELILGVSIDDNNAVGNQIFEEGVLIGTYTVDWLKDGVVSIENTNSISISRDANSTAAIENVYEARVTLEYTGALSGNSECIDSYFFEVEIPEKLNAAEILEDRIEASCVGDLTTLKFEVTGGKDGLGPYTIILNSTLQASSSGPNDRTVTFNVLNPELITSQELRVFNDYGCETIVPNYSIDPPLRIPFEANVNVVSITDIDCSNNGQLGQIELAIDQFPTDNRSIEIIWTSNSGVNLRSNWTSPANFVLDEISRADNYSYEVKIYNLDGSFCVLDSGVVVVEEIGGQQIILNDIEVIQPGCEGGELGSIILEIDESTIVPPINIEWEKRDVNSSNVSASWQSLNAYDGFGSLIDIEVGTYRAIISDQRLGNSFDGCESGVYETREISVARESITIKNINIDREPLGNCGNDSGVNGTFSFRVESNILNNGFPRDFEISLVGQNNSAVINNQVQGNIVIDASDPSTIGQNFIISGLTNDRWTLTVNEILSGNTSGTTRNCSSSFIFDIEPFESLEYTGIYEFLIDECTGQAEVTAQIAGGLPYVENGQEYYIYDWRFTPYDENGLPSASEVRTFVGKEIPGGIERPGILELTVEDSEGCSITNVGNSRNFPVLTVGDITSPFKITPGLLNVENNENVFALEPNCGSNQSDGEIGFNISGGVQPYEVIWYVETATSSTTSGTWTPIPSARNSTAQNNLSSGNYKIVIQSIFTQCGSNERTYYEDYIQVPVNDELLPLNTPILKEQDLCFENAGRIYLDIFDNQASNLTFYYNQELIQNPVKLNSTQYSLDITEPQEYGILEVRNTQGCNISFEIKLGIGEAMFTFTSPSNMIQNSSAEVKSVLTNEPVTFNNLSSDPYVIEEWIFGDNSESIIINKNEGNISPITHTYALPGTYVAILNIYNEIGCVSSQYKPIIVGDGYNVMVPNVFTPNSDGINDRFFPLFSGFKNVTFEVFDHRGNLLYTEYQESNNLQYAEPFDIEGWAGPEINQSNLNSADNNPYYIYNFFGTTFLENKIIEKSGAFILAR